MRYIRFASVQGEDILMVLEDPIDWLQFLQNCFNDYFLGVSSTAAIGRSVPWSLTRFSTRWVKIKIVVLKINYVNVISPIQVASSRRTIVVLSSSYLESTWSKMEFQAAHAKGKRERAQVGKLAFYICSTLNITFVYLFLVVSILDIQELAFVYLFLIVSTL